MSKFKFEPGWAEKAGRESKDQRFTDREVYVPRVDGLQSTQEPEVPELDDEGRDDYDDTHDEDGAPIPVDKLLKKAGVY